MRTKDSLVSFPTSFYVGFCIRKETGADGQPEDVLLGFATPTAEKKTPSMEAAFIKRRTTVDNWANYTARPDGSMYRTSWEIDYNSASRSYVEKQTDIPITDPTYPKVIDNDLIDGFKIQATARRWGGHFGSKETKWRIADPRGFELEITSGNLAFVIDAVGISAGGIIQGKCCWGRAGGSNVLVPEDSETYKRSHEVAVVKSGGSISLKDIKRGSLIETLRGEVEYYGNVHLVVFDKYSPSFKVITRYVTIPTKQDHSKPVNIEFETSIKATRVVLEAKTEVTSADVVQMINDKIGQNANEPYRLNGSNLILLAHSSKKTLEGMTFKHEVLSDSQMSKLLQIAQVEFPNSGTIKLRDNAGNEYYANSHYQLMSKVQSTKPLLNLRDAHFRNPKTSFPYDLIVKRDQKPETDLLLSLRPANSTNYYYNHRNDDITVRADELFTWYEFVRPTIVAYNIEHGISTELSRVYL